MRAGYDRVFSDTRRPPVPDLPLSDAQERDEFANSTGRGIIALMGFVAFMLMLASFSIGLGLYSQESMRPAVTSHVTAAQ